MRSVLDTTLCDKVCQRLVTGLWFSPVSFTNKTDRHIITEILLKVALNTINQNSFATQENYKRLHSILIITFLHFPVQISNIVTTSAIKLSSDFFTRFRYLQIMRTLCDCLFC
jgi:hypothetical protein